MQKQLRIATVQLQVAFDWEPRVSGTVLIRIAMDYNIKLSEHDRKSDSPEVQIPGYNLRGAGPDFLVVQGSSRYQESQGKNLIVLEPPSPDQTETQFFQTSNLPI